MQANTNDYSEESSLFNRKETNLIQVEVDSPYRAHGVFGEYVQECTPLVLIPDRRSIFNPRLVMYLKI